MKRKPLLLIIVLLIGVQLAAVLPVKACSGMFRETTPQEHVDDASLVLVGTVTDQSDSDRYEANYTIQVENYLKGDGPDTILITGYGYGGGDCQDAIAIGERWLFLVDGDPKSDEVLQASYLQVYDSIQEASEGNITFTSTLTGQQPTLPYSTPIWTLIKYWAQSSAFKAAILVGVPALVIVSGLAIGMRLRRRPSSKKKNS